MMITRHPQIRNTEQGGFTLIEVVLVIVIIGILLGIAVQNGAELFETAKVEETKAELDALATAITGNAELVNNGVRADFGYVGDVGSLPPNLDALYHNPGGFATWNGPYVANRFRQAADDYRKDAWGIDYAYGGGVTITSTGSGSAITRRVANSANELLANSVSGSLFDRDGTPPGIVYADSLSVRLRLPDGSGGTVVRTTPVDAGGYFTFDSVPIGNHPLRVVYRPGNDTLFRTVSVPPGSNSYAELRLAGDVWHAAGGTGGGLTKATGSDSLVVDCHGFYFWIENNTGGPVDVSSLTVTWSGFTGYYRYVRWDGTTVVDENNPSPGSGDPAAFTSTQTMNDGETVPVEIDFFKSGPSGGADVNVDNITFTVELSDGTSLDVTTGVCP